MARRRGLGLGLGLGLGSGGESELPIKPLRIIANGGYLSDDLIGDRSRSEARTDCLVGGQPVSEISFIYFNGYLNTGEKVGSNNITIRCCLEKITGGAAYHIGTFEGQEEFVLAPGQWVRTDPFYPSDFGLSSFPANWQGKARTDCVVGAGGKWPITGNALVGGETDTGSVTNRSNAASTQIYGTGPLTMPSGGQARYAFTPQAIVGRWVNTPDISAMLLGTSVLRGSNGSFDDYNGSGIGGGYFRDGIRSVNGRSIPHVQFSRPSEAVKDWAGKNNFRKYIMQYCTHLATDYGYNDIPTRSTAQIIADLKNLYLDFKTNGAGVKNITQMPIWPNATSTDSFATPAGMTAASGWEVGGKRDVINTAFASLLGAPDGFNDSVDINSAWQDQTKLDVWKSDGTPSKYASDPLHPTQFAHNIAKSLVTTVANLWTTS